MTISPLLRLVLVFEAIHSTAKHAEFSLVSTLHLGRRRYFVGAARR